MSLNILQLLCPQNKYSIKCPYSMSPTRIVVHNTANDASALAEVSYMVGNNDEVSFHYAVDNNQVVQGIPENRSTWNAGDGNRGKGNREGISIEVCYSKSGGSKFIQAEKNAVDLIVKILKERNWGISQVTKHQDYSGKYCPHRTLDMGWQRFLNMVKARLDEVNAVATTQVKIDTTMDVTKKRGEYYVVECNCNKAVDLYPGTGDVVTIVKVPSNGTQQRFAIVPIGQAGESTGIYTRIDGENPLKRFVFKISA